MDTPHLPRLALRTRHAFQALELYAGSWEGCRESRLGEYAQFSLLGCFHYYLSEWVLPHRNLMHA